MATLFFVSLHNFAPLADAAALFSNIFYEADVKVSRTQLSMITADRSRWFVAVLHIWEPFFNDYYIDKDITSRISLPTFHCHMNRARKDHCSSMNIRMQKGHNYLFLEFKNSKKDIYRRMFLSPSREEDLTQTQIDNQNFFSIHSSDFRRIITEVSHLPNDLVIVVTVTNSQVKFSVSSKEIILTEEVKGWRLSNYRL
ncbi:uncharacterized protein LOC103497732 [Cucumis melo]|uniref:Uncharacterized protein LOC103497732 n=1 Tax=Cucumis melo TaxID=3656 RepID=A0A1S3C7K5_CUCME|nr:uncharacterized protein LOC103497732 [Cucumis melo]